VAQFKRDYFSTIDAPRPGRPKTVTTPEISDQIHELILEDRQISAKSIATGLLTACCQQTCMTYTIAVCTVKNS